MISANLTFEPRTCDVDFRTAASSHNYSRRCDSIPSALATEAAAVRCQPFATCTCDIVGNGVSAQESSSARASGLQQEQLAAVASYACAGQGSTDPHWTCSQDAKWSASVQVKSEKCRAAFDFSTLLSPAAQLGEGNQQCRRELQLWGLTALGSALRLHAAGMDGCAEGEQYADIPQGRYANQTAALWSAWTTQQLQVSPSLNH